MTNIISVKMRFFRKINKFIYRLENFSINDKLILKTKRGVEFGTVVAIEKVKNFEVPEQLEGLIIRRAERIDFDKIKQIEKEESNKFNFLNEKIKQYDLPMKLVLVEYMFDMKKIIVYFSAENRIDFRNLLKDLVENLKTWVELRQISPREVTKIMGGIGVCGKELCCFSFLREFKNVHMQSAVFQGISFGGSKLCGVCGRLMCCLKYEEDMYLDILEKVPKVNEIIKTPKGLALVAGVDIMKEAVKVVLLDDPTGPNLCFKLSDLIRLTS
ncbi:MAG: stage 0 sporulation protein [Firmicutes bacterium]|nr:stage 0 sporulation protein [Bacillota bacterium]